MLKLIPREKALEALGIFSDSRLRNYEIEQDLNEMDPLNEYVVQGWCPFNGIHCTFFEYSDRTWLLPALEAHKKEVEAGRMNPHVVERIKDRLQRLGVQPVAGALINRGV